LCRVSIITFDIVFALISKCLESIFDIDFNTIDVCAILDDVKLPDVFLELSVLVVIVALRPIYYSAQLGQVVLLFFD
jgi:hypothetical protein